MRAGAAVRKILKVVAHIPSETERGSSVRVSSPAKIQKVRSFVATDAHRVSKVARYFEAPQTITCPSCGAGKGEFHSVYCVAV